LLFICLGAASCAVQAPTCPNGRVDGFETDLDCGGSQCPACPADGICLEDGDCQSGVCALNRCQAATCHDGLQNGGELGVDCGGPCAACAVSNGTCTDGQKSDAETDIDCGGAQCAACADGKSCARNTDCTSQVCADGRCGAPCTSPWKVCGPMCVDTSIDPLHCGDCGVVCVPGQACVAGACRDVCLGGSRFCGASCVDSNSNPFHCGGCNQPCAAGQLCSGGSCASPCPIAQTLCNGACVSIMRDPLNCGGCNATPCGAGKGCVDGQCQLGCPAPLEVCDSGNVCADTQNDPFHCGDCTNTCPVPNGAPRTCVGGQCVLGTCFPGFGNCNAIDSDGCETDLGLPSSCGTCSRVCPGGDFCNLARCCTALPAGTYQATCQQCEACEGQLTCLCQDAAQNLVPASIPLGPCGPGFTNCNGVLMCGGC
jgi:hypothetical protein